MISTNQHSTPPAARGGMASTGGVKRGHALLGLLIAVALAIYTTHKLYRMALIRGIIGDALVERRLVSGKTHHPGRLREICLLSWTEHDAGRASPREVDADCDYWEQVRIGDPIELVRADDGEVHLREGSVYASIGNFGFDFVLLAAELAAAIYCVRRLRRG